MDKTKVENIARVSKVEKWPYPKIFKALKDAGVVSYEVLTAKRHITYYDGEQSFEEPVPKGFTTLDVAGAYSIQGLKQALENVQKGKTNYEEFLKEIAQAGIHRYRVEMSTNTVTYYSAKPGEAYAEKVPQYKEKR